MKPFKPTPKLIAGVACVLIATGAVGTGLWQNRAELTSKFRRSFYPNEYMDWLRKAKDQAAANHYDKALEYAIKAAELRPDSYQAHNCVGDCYLRLKQYEKAIAPYTLAISLEPENFRAYLGRGQCNAELGKLDEAGKDFDRGFELNPAIHEFVTAKCGMYIQRGQFYKAVETAQDIDDRINKPWTREIAYEAARVLIMHNLKRLKKEPRNDRIWATLGYAYSAAHEFPKALTCMDEAISIDKNNTALYVIRSRILLRQGEVRLAKADANRALLADPLNSVALKLSKDIDARIKADEAREAEKRKAAEKQRLELEHPELQQLEKVKSRAGEES